MTEIIQRPQTPEEAAEQKAYEAEAYERAVAEIDNLRRQGYQTQSDPIYFEWQRGDKTEQEWLDAVQAVKDAHPYPVKGK